MPQNFGTPRNVEISCMNYLKTGIAAATWTGVTVCQTFAQVYATNVVLPVVCVRLSDTQTKYIEIGSTTMDDRYLLIVDIFCTSDAQRLDLAYTVKYLLSQGWAHYDYHRPSGNTTGTLTANPDGFDLITSFVSDSRVDFGDTVDAKDRYRHTISVRVRHSSLIPVL